MRVCPLSIYLSDQAFGLQELADVMAEGLAPGLVEVYSVKAGGVWISEERGGVDGVTAYQMFELSDDNLGAVIYEIF